MVSRAPTAQADHITLHFQEVDSSLKHFSAQAYTDYTHYEVVLKSIHAEVSPIKIGT